MENKSQRTYLQEPDEVFSILLDILNENYDVKDIDESMRIVEVSTGMSLFSFGENFEILVTSGDTGSVVRVKGKSKIKWNMTSDIEKKVNEIFEFLDERLAKN